MPRLSAYLFAIALLSCCSTSHTARILGLFTSPSKSHLIVHMAVAKALADSGHNVTVVTTLPYGDAQPVNYRAIQLDVPGGSNEFISEMINKPKPFHEQFMTLARTAMEVADRSLNHPAMKRLMAEETFDLVILGYFLNDFQLGVAAHFKCPVIVNFMMGPVSGLNLYIGNPLEVAYVPNLFLGMKQPMDFWQRVGNFLYTQVLEKVLFRIVYESKAIALYEENFPSSKYPSYADMKKNVSLLMVNHHFSQKPIRPNVPALIEIGGIQIKEQPDPLPEDIKTFLDSANETGAIYFSFGSVFKGSVFDKQKAQIIFQTLAKFPNKVLIKWDSEELPFKSEKFLYKSWLPQDDVLAHPNVRLFVTHGGKGSIVESQYHGVPMVGIPIFGDQAANMASVEDSGYGLMVDLKTLSEESLYAAVTEVLATPKYREETRTFATIFKDRPMTPRETVVYWVDYVLRHRGAGHMQSPLVHMNWFQQNSLDVISIFLIGLYLIVKFICLIVKFIRVLLFRKMPSDKIKNE